MKKLMVMAVVAVAAAYSQAATFNWTGSYITDASKTSMANNMPVYLFAQTGGVGYSASGDALIAGDWTLNQVAAAVADGTFMSGDWISKAVDTATVASGALSHTSKNYTSGIKNGDMVDLLAVFVDSTSQAPEVMAMSMATSSPIQADTISGMVDWGLGYGAYGKEYTAQTVPEPTSGLLLLLGVAGLALRRRRA